MRSVLAAALICAVLAGPSLADKADCTAIVGPISFCGDPEDWPLARRPAETVDVQYQLENDAGATIDFTDQRLADLEDVFGSANYPGGFAASVAELLDAEDARVLGEFQAELAGEDRPSIALRLDMDGITANVRITVLATESWTAQFTTFLPEGTMGGAAIHSRFLREVRIDG